MEEEVVVAAAVAVAVAVHPLRLQCH